jgi:lysophospholipase-3
MTDRSSFPMVDVYAEQGSGIDTLVGLGLRDLTVGRPLDPALPMFTRDGDVNQEDIANNPVLAWRAMPCFHFSLTDSPGVDHFALPSNPGVLSRLVADGARPRSRCR